MIPARPPQHTQLFRTIPSSARAARLAVAATALLLFAGAEVSYSQVAASAPVKPTTSAAQNAPTNRSGRFHILPRDVSLQPVPPKTTGKIEFIGNKSYTADQLKEPMAEQIKEIDAEGLTRPRADDAAYYLSVYYRKQGFANVDVKWDIRGDRLLLRISEGARTYLRHVTFVGNRVVDSKTLYEYMIGGTEDRAGKKPVQVPFVEADIQDGVSRLRGYYDSEGRLEAKVDDPIITYSSNHASADVVVHLTEGPRYVFGNASNVTFSGETGFTKAQLIDALGQPLSKSPSDPAPKTAADPLANPYTTQRLNALEHNLLYFYKLHGYYNATVQATGDPKKWIPGPSNDRRVPTTFVVHSGPVFHFDGTTVTGLQRTRPSFFEHRFASLKGKVYTPTELDEKYREVLRTGIFKNLQLHTVPLPTNEVRADFTAEEAKAKEIGFSIGFSTYEGAILGLRLADRNLNGNGRPLSLQVETSQRGIRAELLYVDPWFLESDFSLRSRIFSTSREEEGYSKLDTGLRFDLTRKLNKNIEFGTFLEGKNVNVSSDVIDPIYLGPTSYQIFSLGFTQNYDFRDNPVNPTKGWITTSGIDGGMIAGELAYGRATARVTYLIPILNRFVLALGARGGIIYPLTQVPIDERFFNGGSTTVRSFQERQLGPHEPHGNPIGGEAFSVFNAEFTFPIKDALKGAVFVDAGNVAGSYKNVGLQEMRYAIGVGLRYNLPIGPVRLDVGLNPDPKQDEDWGAVHFSIGFAF